MINMKRALWWAVPVGCGLLIFLLLHFVVFVGYVPTSSMEPTIAQDSYIFGLRYPSRLQVDDVIVFEHDQQQMVKRIAAGPGQTVYINEATGDCSVGLALEDATRVLQVPDGHFFVLGDNRFNSSDSRYWEHPFVPEENIIAVLLV